LSAARSASMRVVAVSGIGFRLEGSLRSRT
jgi:hypothetical protein